MKRLIAAVAAAALFLPCAAALAAETPTKEGMPQLNFSNPLTLSQVGWMAIIFLVLYVVFSRWTLPQVARVVEHRAASIASDLDAARQAKAEADAAMREATQASRKAHADARPR